MVYSEKFYPNGAPPYEYHHRMVTDGQWKLIRYEEKGSVTEELYWLDPSLWLDGDDLLGTISSSGESAAAHERLSIAMNARIDALQFAH
ncbi:MAG: hypothetical protein ACI8RZ_006555 [Myxococcota bacterium]